MLNRSSADLPTGGSLSKQREPLEVIFPALAQSHRQGESALREEHRLSQEIAWQVQQGMDEARRRVLGSEGNQGN